MRTFEIIICNKNNKKTSTKTVNYLTFQEAARDAYSTKHTLGHDWNVSSIYEILCEKDNSSQLEFSFES